MFARFVTRQSRNIYFSSLLNTRRYIFSIPKNNKRIHRNYTPYFLGLSFFSIGTSESAEDLLQKGEDYFLGRNTPVDYEKAVYYFELSANAGSTKALSNLGVCAANGYGMKQDFKKSVEFHEAAAERGDAQALFQLSIRYQFGEGVEKNIDTALSYLKKAASLGVPTAMNNLGIYYLSIGRISEGLELLKKAGEAGESGSLFYIGVYTINGDYIEKNVELGKSILRQSSERGCQEAQKVLDVIVAVEKDSGGKEFDLKITVNLPTFG